QRYETFYIDLGAVFDTVNLRRKPLPLLSAAEDANDNADPFGNNRFSGFDINTMAIELPISAITSDKAGPDRTTNPVIGVYASTSRQQIRVLHKTGVPNELGIDTQVSRLANPLVNELIIDTPFKDRWNASEPEDEAQFQNFYRTPTIPPALNLLTGAAFTPTPPPDLMQWLLKYRGQLSTSRGLGGNPCVELLRRDVSNPPPGAENKSRLGSFFGGDPA